MSTRQRGSRAHWRRRSTIGVGSAKTAAQARAELDTAALEHDLRGALDGEVRFGDGDRALYATDGSNYRQVPIGVVVPAHRDDVLRTLAIARRHGAPVLARGGGTSLAGQCCNTAVVMDMTKYFNRILAIDPDRRRARVEPGCVLDHLCSLTRRCGLTFGPDPATHNHNTLGGMIGNDSCGPHSVQSEFYGPGARTADQIESMEIVTGDGVRMTVGDTSEAELDAIIAAGGRRGEIYAGMRDLRDRYADLIRARYPKIVRRVSGYNLPHLLPENGFNVARALVGSEGTLVTVLEATVGLIPDPPKRALLVLGYPSVYDAGDHVPQLREFKPLAIEGMDDLITEFMRRKNLLVEDLTELPPGKGWLLVEFGGDTQEEADEKARAAMERIRASGHAPAMALHTDPRAQEKLWTVRRSGLGATAFVPGEPLAWEGWEDTAVPVDRVGDYLRAFHELLRKYDYRTALYGHFGQGLLHCRIDFDLFTAEGIDRYRRFTEEGAHLVVRFGGSLSGEHGDGQSRADLLPIMFGNELVEAFREFKRIWDPIGMMNPGKVVNAYPRTSNLRLGTDYRPANPETTFQFPEDEGSLARATLRCVGVGECRRHDGGLMCPSYQVTLEEKHSTRGRAHLLNEMLRGETITDGWRSEDVKEALDLCLSCKGCKHDCPVNVDMATYKAEFLSHYYEGRIRPRHAYAIGLIHLWTRVAQLAPEVANFFTHAPGLSWLAHALGGIARQREIPRFAPLTFRRWWRRRSRPLTRGHRGRVVLWADTFNDNFFPATLAAAAEVLEAGGYDIVVPGAELCCGRPLYDFGMLDQARKQLLQILDALRPEIEAGTPVVGLEPSCVSVFRDEMRSLLPHDQDARRLADRVLTLAEFVAAHPDHFDLPRLDGKALVHGHCHDRSIMHMKGAEAVLQKLGVEYSILQDTCCGLAGAFGFEADKYGISMAIGEHSLFPSVRAADPETLLISDGFSCREQIAHGTDRRGLHLAEVMLLALRQARAPGSRRRSRAMATQASSPVGEATEAAASGAGPQRKGLPCERAAASLAPRDLVAPGLSTGTISLVFGGGALALAGLGWLALRARD